MRGRRCGCVCVYVCSSSPPPPPGRVFYSGLVNAQASQLSGEAVLVLLVLGRGQAFRGGRALVSKKRVASRQLLRARARLDAGRPGLGHGGESFKPGSDCSRCERRRGERVGGRRGGGGPLVH